MTSYAHDFHLVNDLDGITDLDFDDLWRDLNFEPSAADQEQLHDSSCPAECVDWSASNSLIQHTTDSIQSSFPLFISKTCGVKKSMRKSGGKIGKKQKVTKSDIQLMSTEGICTMSAPNISKRRKYFPFYAFPKFHKCDALPYFPTTMITHLNSGDFSSLTDLFSSHLDKNCVVIVDCDNAAQQLTFHDLLQLFAFESEIHPDLLMCIHSTNITDNEIRGRLYYKCTSNDDIHESLRRTVTNPVNTYALQTTRAERVKMNMKLESHPEEMQRTVSNLLDSKKDVLLYGHMDLCLRCDAGTNRVTNFSINCALTSVVEAKI